MRPKAYPKELRERVIRAWQTTEGRWEQLAELFDVGRATVNRWIGRFRRTGSVAPLPHGGGQSPRISAEQLPILKGLVDEKPDRTLAELAAWYEARTGVSISTATVVRGLKRLGYTRRRSPSRPASGSTRGYKRGARGSASVSTASPPSALSSSTKPARTSR
jgi:transposase